MIRCSRVVRGLLLAVAIAALVACQRAEGELPVPTANEVLARYVYHGKFDVKVRGNAVELHAYQPVDQVRRGGDLWAKVGPHVLLFSNETRLLFDDFPGIAAVRAITLLPDGQEIARATLPRDTLNELTWRRALNIAGDARVEGTRYPSQLEALVRWGEDHTKFRYNRRFIRP